jgi:hypothetical protein
MGFTETLTVLLVVLKLVGVIHISWFFALLPEILALSVYVILFFIFGAGFVTLMISALRVSKKSKITGRLPDDRRTEGR